MPLTDIQKEILLLLASHRNENAYIAGGLISSKDGPRYSDDIDFFHDSTDLTLRTFEADKRKLEENGYSVTTLNRPQPGFVRAIASKTNASVKIDWAHDAAWHFFAPEPDPVFGFRLHNADAATNKILAFASRREPRDVVDAMFWHDQVLSLGALVWAASGKDAGLSPGLILEEISRNARISPDEISELNFSGTVDPVDIGRRFRSAVRDAEDLILSLPLETAGHLFVDDDFNPIEPDPSDKTTLERTLAPSQGGLIPQIRDLPTP